MKRDSEAAIVSEKGQVTIPKRLRDRLGIGPGQVLEFREVRGTIVATKARGVDTVAEVYGALKLPGGTDAAVTRLRGAPDAT